MKLSEKLSLFLATGFGLGYIVPIGQGTLGALSALAAVPFFLSRPAWEQALFIVLGVFLGAYVSSKAEKVFGTKDDHRIIIDEIVSIFITFFLFPAGTGWAILALGFFLNRFFDILKPLGIYRLQSLPAGWGIMADDVLGGVYANLTLRIFLLTFGFFFL